MLLWTSLNFFAAQDTPGAASGVRDGEVINKPRGKSESDTMNPGSVSRALSVNWGPVIISAALVTILLTNHRAVWGLTTNGKARTCLLLLYNQLPRIPTALSNCHERAVMMESVLLNKLHFARITFMNHDLWNQVWCMRSCETEYHCRSCQMFFRSANWLHGRTYPDAEVDKFLFDF